MSSDDLNKRIERHLFKKKKSGLFSVAIGKVDEKKGKKNKHKKKEEEKEFDPRSEYQKLVWDVSNLSNTFLSGSVFIE